MPARRLALAVAIVLVLGTALSAGATILYVRSETVDQHRGFRAAAHNVTATLATLVGRDVDFVETLRTLMTLDPGLDPVHFQSWYRMLQGSQRQVGGIGSAVVEAVPGSKLTRFLQWQARGWAYAAGAARWIAPEPGQPGPRGRYCLVAASSVAGGLSPIATGLLRQNWCDPTTTVGESEANELQTAARAGGLTVVPIAVSWLHTTVMEVPYYGRGVALRTPAQRAAAVRGWIVGSFDFGALIRQALGSNRGVSATLSFVNPGGHGALVRSAGAATGPLTARARISADGAWTVTVRGIAPASGVSPLTGGLLIAGAGGVVTVLLALLVLTLSRSRERALAIVAEKTGQLRHQALHDPLTGLPNRVLAIDRAEHMLSRARRAQGPIALLYIDIDGFKHVNDTFGHAIGDEFLKQVATRIQTVVRACDTAARLSGDEFMVLLEALTLDVAPELVAERLLAMLREPYDLTQEIGRELSLTASIGVAHGLAGSAEALLADADVALYAAKEAGRDRFIVFESGMQTAAHDRVSLEMDLADALAAGELSVAYQPTFDLRSERPTGAEALLRWRHPTRGSITPDLFIPIAERSGLIRPIGRWVLRTACLQAAAWREQGHDLAIAVNVSGRQLDHDDLVRDVREALDASGLDAHRLTIEITETSLMRDPQASARRLRVLKQLGVRVAIDDFGTGYSSLAYLRQFPVDQLKIDRAFVSGIATSRESAALVRTLIDLGRTLGLETLGEGIEDLEQLRALQRARCDSGQGFLLGPPATPDQIRVLLGDHRPGQPLPAAADA